MNRCLRGDRKALATVVEKYQKPLFNAAYRILGNPQDAADVTQTTFLKAFEHLDTYDPKYKFFSWIYRIAVNESFNQLKRNRRHEPLAESTAGAVRGPSSTAEDGDLKQWIQDGLMALSEDYRTVMVLRHYSDFSYREISHILNIPEKTVKSRLYSARQSMKERLLANGISL